MNSQTPYYKSVGKEVEVFEQTYLNKIPFLLKGPTGTGKSRFIEFMAHKLGKELITISCHEETSSTDLIGRFIIKGAETIWLDGPLTTAVKKGAIIYLDEIAEARPDVIVAIHSLTDHRRELFIDKLGEVIKAHKDFMLVASFQIYVIIYYVFQGDQSQGTEYFGWVGTLSAASTFLVIFFVSWLSTKIGKKKAFYIATGISIVGYGMKWVCYHPDYPLLTLLPAPFMAFGLGALFTLMGSMIADVCDMDELETGERREGMFGSIYWWVVKLGQAAALAMGGYLLYATGFDVELGSAQSADTIFMMRLFDVVIPMVASAIAIWMVYTYPITEQKAHEIREALEKRRQEA